MKIKSILASEPQVAIFSCCEMKAQGTEEGSLWLLMRKGKGHATHLYTFPVVHVPETFLSGSGPSTE